MDFVRESLHLPPPSPTALQHRSPSSTTGRGSASGCWDVASSASATSAGGDGSGSLGGTLSIVERIQQLDLQKKQAVAR